MGPESLRPYQAASRDISVKFDLGETLPFLYGRFLELIGKDASTKDLADWFARLQKTAIVGASQVQCIGMYRPLPIDQIYQPTRLVMKGALEKQEQLEPFSSRDEAAESITQGEEVRGRVMDVDTFLARNESAIV